MPETMLKILKSTRNSFLILILLTTNTLPKDIRLPSDVGSGNTYSKSLGSGFKKHGYTIVNEKDGHPVRSGGKSVRFEVRYGDCGKDKSPGTWNDCESLRQRHELSGERFKGSAWYAYSIYLPTDFVNIFPVKQAMGQFHQKSSWPTLMFQLTDEGYFVDRQWQNQTDEFKKLLDVKEMIGKWNDILIHINSTSKKDGFYKVWVNNELEYEFSGPTTKGNESYFKFGIYHTWINRWNKKKRGPFPTQIVYYDEIRAGKSKKSVTKNLGY